MAILPHPKTIDPFANLSRLLDAESYDWLNSHYPDILNGVEQSIAAGQLPEDIKQFVIRETCGIRLELAQRCYQAARHIKRLQE